jgi:hypothetical protein
LASKVKFTSPFGAARYPHISSPDTKGKFADNKFKTKLVCRIDDPAAKAAVEAIDDAAIEIHGKKGEKLYKPYVIDEEAGEIVFIAKSSYAPAVFDGRGQPAKGVQVGGGSVIRLMGNLVEFDKGISLQLNQVQIKELNGFGTCGFEAIDDGYEYDPSDASFQQGRTASDDTGTNDTGATNGSALDI